MRPELRCAEDTLEADARDGPSLLWFYGLDRDYWRGVPAASSAARRAASDCAATSAARRGASDRDTVSPRRRRQAPWSSCHGRRRGGT